MMGLQNFIDYICHKFIWLIKLTEWRNGWSFNILFSRLL